MQAINIKAARILMDPPDNSERKPFDIQYCTLDGEIIAGRVVCTSSYFENDTLNVKFIESGEVRTIHASLLLQVNGKEVML